MSIGYVISSTFENYAMASQVAPILMMPFMLFGGMYSNLNTMPAWLSWLQWISPIKYATEALVTNEYNRPLSPGEFDILNFLKFDFGMWYCILVLACMALFCRIIAVFALKQLITKF